MTITEIRQRKAAKVAEARAAIAANDQSAFANLQTEIAALEAAENLQAAIDDSERRSVTTTTTPDTVSLLDVIRAGMEGRAITGAAAEQHAELERRHGAAKHGGILVPLSAFERRATTTASAPELVATTHRPDLFIGPLRNSLLVQRLGVRTLSGLVGNVSIPKYGTGLSVGWVPEGGALPESELSADSVTLTPRHVGGITELSRQLIQQSAPDIEALVRDDLSYAIAAAVDAAIISGTGLAGQPLGIIGRAGVQTAALPNSWPSILAIEQKLAAVNVAPSGWYTSPAALTPLRSILKDDVAGSGYLATGTTIGELPVASSNAAPAGVAILGDWSQILLGQWGAVELLVNPFGDAYRRGGVLVRAMASVDVAVRHEQAFVVAQGV